MKKLSLYIISALLIISCAAIIAYITTQQDDSSEQTDPSPPSREENMEQEMEETEDASVNEPEEEIEETEVPSFPQIIAEAMNQTLDFFENQGTTHIVAIGDSLTQGVGDETNRNGYVGILDRTINQFGQLAEIDNYGKRGNRTDQLLNRLDNEEISASLQDSDIVLITIGANDIMKIVRENIMHLVFQDFVVAQDEYEKRLRNIFDEIRELNPNTEIYLIGFYNPFQEYFQDIKELDLIVETWNSSGANVVSEYENTFFIPTEDLFADPNADLFADDNFHPNYKGYYQIAERVLNYITNR